MAPEFDDVRRLIDIVSRGLRLGIHVTGVLLALDNPWSLIAQQLGRVEEEIKKTLDATVKRRNDIVHRADRSQEDLAGPAQNIGFPWAKQAVETPLVGTCQLISPTSVEPAS